MWRPIGTGALSAHEMHISGAYKAVVCHAGGFQLGLISIAYGCCVEVTGLNSPCAWKAGSPYLGTASDLFISGHCKLSNLPAPPNYPLRDPKYHLIETIRPLIEVHRGSRFYDFIKLYGVSLGWSKVDWIYRA